MQESLEKFSYSKLSVFDKSNGGCPYRYKLIYIDKHFINEKSIALDFGTLLHHVEESIANKIIELGDEFQYLLNFDEFIDMFINLDDSVNKIYGMKKLKQMYPDSFDKKDKTGLTYADKGNIYLNKGIYRLFDYLVNHPNLEIIDTEKKFSLTYQDKYLFNGAIDRVFRDKVTGDFYIEDIKTYNSPLENSKLTTPLQFVFYTLAVKELYNLPSEENIHCAYELPLCDMKQEAGTKGFIKRGMNKIDKLLLDIQSGNMEPNPSPLCHYCPFCETFENQPEEAKNLCPYFCLWTREKPTFETKNPWMGILNHEKILENYINNRKTTAKELYSITENDVIAPADVSTLTERRFILRRQ